MSERGWRGCVFRTFCQNNKRDKVIDWTKGNAQIYYGWQQTVPDEGASFAAVVEPELLGGLLPSAPAPSGPGALRISLDVIEDIPVTAQPAQLEELPAG